MSSNSRRRDKPVKRSKRQRTISFGHRVLAVCVHSFTASGAVMGVLAVEAIVNEQWRLAFGWLIVALIVDAVDGTVARIARVKAVLPDIDGDLLDNIVDYFTYAIVPAFLVYRAELLPADFALLGAAAIIMVSGYQFSQSDAKTVDYYFKGWPSCWNVVAFYLFALDAGQWVNLALVITFCALTFVPVKYLYPTRTVPYKRLTLALSIAWGVCATVIYFQLPDPYPPLVYVSLLYFVYYIGMSVYLTVARAKPRETAPAP